LLYLVVGIVLGLVLALVFLAISVTASSEHLDLPDDIPSADDPAFLDLVSLSGEVRFSGANDVEILVDGASTYPRLFEDLRGAGRTVTLQLYFCQPGDLADELAGILTDRVRAGVRVLFLYDAFGSDLPDSYLEPLRQAGVDVRAFRPVRWWTLHKAQERSHARIVVIDGAVGYTGGFGIDDRWSAGGTEDEPGWRDTNVRFTGPVVASLQAAFASSWAETAGELLVDAGFYPGIRNGDSSYGLAPPRMSHPVVAGLVHSRPDLGSSTAERLFALTIAAARKTLYIANAYFVPSRDFRNLLIDAARRGVDVRILAPSEKCDIPLVRHAGRAHFTELLRGGVRIWEYQPAMMHAKTWVVDAVWSAIGTLNLDNRSLAMNEETSLLVHDPDTGAYAERLFHQDLTCAVEMTPVTFARRGALDRVRERVAVAGSRLL
jgi:cardiolipin synthase A/B